MNATFWNERYALKDFVYGIEPNEFLKERIQHLKPGKALFIAEGEGRNAVYAAQLGWQVTAVDQSEAGKQKALQLAASKNVEIDYRVADVLEPIFEVNSFDLIVFIYAHFPLEVRETIHKRACELLAPAGTIILEGFHKTQLNYTSGGPKNEAMLFSKAELEQDFKVLKDLTITEELTILDEGEYHQGEAAVMRLIGSKN